MAIYPKKIKKAFASEGQYNVIPDDPKVPGEGYANYAEGFPPELSKPFSETGKAVQRLDFNGILNHITLFQMYQQAGGMFKYDAEEEYAPPAIIYDPLNNSFYQCMTANGPLTGFVVTPSSDTSERFWRPLVGGNTIKEMQAAIDRKRDKSQMVPAAEISGLKQYIDNNNIIGAQTFSSSAKSSRYNKVEFTVSANRDSYGRLTSLSLSNSNCVDTDTDTDVDTDTDYDSDNDTDSGY